MTAVPPSKNGSAEMRQAPETAGKSAYRLSAEKRDEPS